MKKDIHPDYHTVVFEDISTGKKFITRSTVRARKKTQVEGEECDHIICDITSDSHPVYTGEKRFVDTAGRVEKFQTKFRRRR